MNIEAGNLFAHLPAASAQEQITVLVSTPGVKIERIVSTGQASPPDFWYDQAEAEWVVVLAGSAAIQFEGTSEPQLLTPGDYLLIAPHRRHRIHFTDSTRPTIWLAVHVASSPNGV